MAVEVPHSPDKKGPVRQASVDDARSATPGTIAPAKTARSIGDFKGAGGDASPVAEIPEAFAVKCFARGGNHNTVQDAFSVLHGVLKTLAKTLRRLVKRPINTKQFNSFVDHNL